MTLSSLKNWLKDMREDYRRRIPGEMRPLGKYDLSVTQVYPNGINILEHINLATSQGFESIQVNTDTPVASIGTCFAEEFAAHMKAKDGNYLYEEANVFNSSANWGRVYTVPNLLQILKYSTDSEFPVLIEKGKDGFIDPLREHSVGSAESRDLITSRIAGHRKASKLVFEKAELLVLTLGQNEAWYDNHLEIVWGSIPPQEIMKEDRARFNPKEFSFDENLEMLKEGIRILRQINPSQKVIITVSPVAAFATFMADDVVTQSFAGKCMLRNVVHTLLKGSEFEEIFYFPSFEISLCNNPCSFTADNRHVKRKTVSRIFSILDNAIQGKS